MAEQETNPVILVLAKVAAAVERRERDAGERRRTIRLVERSKGGGRAA